MALRSSGVPLRILTLNVWGLHYLGSKRIRERLTYIAQELKHYDIVGLQEVWKRTDFEYLVSQLKDDLPHHHYFHNGAIGSGLCVFSRHPIKSASARSFHVCGSMGNLLDGELLSGKGIMMCRIIVASEMAVAFYNTHLNPRHRDSECYEIYQFVEHTRGNATVIMTGDYNTKSSQNGYSFLVTAAELEDVFADDPVDTCDLTSNMYTLPHKKPKRIDYIFFSSQRSTSSELILQERNLALSGLIPGKDFPFSDHEGVEATFQLVPGGKKEKSLNLSPQRKAALEQVFLQMAANLREKQTYYKSSAVSIIGQWVGVALGLFFLSLLVNAYIQDVLVSCGLGCLSFVGVAIGGGLGVAWVVQTLISAKICLSLEANLTDIMTSLRYIRR